MLCRRPQAGWGVRHHKGMRRLSQQPPRSCAGTCLLAAVPEPDSAAARVDTIRPASSLVRMCSRRCALRHQGWAPSARTAFSSGRLALPALSLLPAPSRIWGRRDARPGAQSGESGLAHSLMPARRTSCLPCLPRASWPPRIPRALWGRRRGPRPCAELSRLLLQGRAWPRAGCAPCACRMQALRAQFLDSGRGQT